MNKCPNDINNLHYNVIMNAYRLPSGTVCIQPDHIRIRFSDDKVTTCFLSTTLSQYLNMVKLRINKYPQEWDNVKRVTNQYEYIHTQIPNGKQAISKIKPLSRAFFKLIEICNSQDLFKDYDNEPIKSFHLAEGPGGFIEAMTHLRYNSKDMYYGMTLIDNKNDNVPGWKKSALFLRKNPNISIEPGADGTGNLYTPENLDHCYKEYRNQIDIITADGGFDFSVDFNKQELMAMKLIFAEVIYAITMQKIGGSFILKTFDTFLKGTVDIIFILSCFYTSVYITKPCTSRTANSERYVVCEGFKQVPSPALIKKLRAVLVILNNPSIDNLTIGALLDIDMPYHFIKRLEEVNAILGAQQIDNILTTLRFIENKERKGEKIQQIKNNNIQKCIQWCEQNNIPHYKTANTGNIFMSGENRKVRRSPFLHHN